MNTRTPPNVELILKIAHKKSLISYHSKYITLGRLNNSRHPSVFLSRRFDLYTPPLYTFALGYFFGLIFFHNQGWLNSHLFFLGHTELYSISVVSTWALTCLAYHKLITRKILILTIGFLSAYCVAGLQATHRQYLQIPLSCHSQEATAQFKLLEKKQTNNQQAHWLAEVTQSQSACLKQDGQVWLSGETETLQAGNSFKATVKLKAARTTLPMTGFDVHSHWFAQSVAGFVQLKTKPVDVDEGVLLNPFLWLERLRNSVAQWLTQTLNGHPEQPLLVAMVIGDQGLISSTDRDLFADTGIAHLVAISGLHITLFALLAGELFARMWKRSTILCLRTPAKVAGATFGLFFAIVYGLVAGWGIPAQRTVLMLAALLASRLRNTSPNPWDVFFLALLLTLLSDSWAVLDTGFYLSFVAVGSLIFSSHGRQTFTVQRWQGLKVALYAQYAVTVGMLVPCAVLFNQQSIVSPFSNALSIPWMSFISTPLALLGSLFHQKWAIFLAADSLHLQRIWLDYLGALDWRTLALPDQHFWVYALAELGAIILLLPKGIGSKPVGCALMALLLVQFDTIEEGAFRAEFLDVGQGTSVGIRTKNHILIYDTGPAMSEASDSGRRIVLPWIRSVGTRQLDALWVSHDDNDHSGGAQYVLKHAHITSFVSSLPAEHPLNTLAKTQKTRTDDCNLIKPWHWDGVLFEPLPYRILTHTSKSESDNNHSCVLKVSNRYHSVLLTGDIEAEAEQALLQSYPPNTLHSELLLSPHHGSKTSSTPDFVDTVAPHIIIIQSGWMNRYHHPHPSVITRYHNQGIPIYNTAQNGALRVDMPTTNELIVPLSASNERKRYWHTHESSAQ